MGGDVRLSDVAGPALGDGVSDDRMRQLERLVTDPTLVSDGTLRAAIAGLMGWRIDARYYMDTGKPWAADYYARRCALLQDEIDRYRLLDEERD